MTHLDSSVSVEEYVEIDNALCIEEEDLDISNFILQTNEKFALFNQYKRSDDCVTNNVTEENEKEFTDLLY